jgi:hypothetical protein
MWIRVNKPAVWIRVLLAGSIIVRADAPTASVTGTVTDPSGGVMAAVSILARNVDTNVVRTTTTNEAGVYQFLGLQAGPYEIEAAQPLFQTVRRRDIRLRVADEVRIDLTLTPGQNRDAVVVTEAAPLVETRTSRVATVVNQNAIQYLPSDGRQVQNLALIVPGVTAGWNVSTAANRYGKARENTEGAFSINGARSRSNDFLFDGMPMNVRQYNVINFEPSNEAVQEFAVISAIPSAEYGRTMGGKISIITRSGASGFHGALYEFFRNDALNANDTLSKRAGLPRGKVRHHQFGGSFGGPIWKQRHFFFVNTELLRNLEGSQTRTSFVPTESERRGLIAYTDAGGAPRTLDLSSRITPLSGRLLDLYPQPNSRLPAGNYTAPLPISVHDSQYHVRTDHHFSEHDVVTLRTSWNLNDQVYIIDVFGGPYIPGFPLPNPERTTNGTLSYLHTFSPLAVNEARLGVNRYGNDLANGDARNAADFGIPNGSSANGIPSLSFSRGGLASLGGLSWYNREQNELTVHGANALSVLHGPHSLKFGVEASRYHFNTRGAGNQRGTITFDGTRNTLIPQTSENVLANVLTDLLLGLPSQASITVGQFGRGYRQWAYAAFVQDSWRVNRRLTVDYGVRYEYSAPWTEVNGKLANFLPGSGIVTPRSQGWDGLYRPDYNNFAPRAGFAYDVGGKGRTVVRGGFGIAYETLLQASTVQQIENNAPFSAAATTFTPVPFSRDDSASLTLLDLRNIAQPSRSLSAVPLQLPNPYSLQFSFDIQHALAANWLLELAYRGTTGVHLPLNYNVNQVPLARLTSSQRSAIGSAVQAGQGTAVLLDALRPYAGFDSISLFENAAISRYHSLQWKLERRFSRGLNLLAAYTWSKSIDDATDFASSDPSERVLDSYNRRTQRALSSFDVPHRFTLAFNYALPMQSWKALLGGWQINGIFTLQSGQPFTPHTTQFDAYRNESFNRLLVTGDPNANVPDGLAYNPSALMLPAQGTFGDSGRNIIRGDGFHTAGLSLSRNIRLHERLQMQVRAEATNVFNQVNYQGPVVNHSTQPGAFVATAAPRTVQLGAKLTF